MTYAQAAYCRIMLICGHAEEYDSIITDLLEAQNPLSDAVLELSFCTHNRKKTLSLLNDYLSKAAESDVDYDSTVFRMILDFLNRLYAAEKLRMREFTELMHTIAQASDRWLEEPWATMNNMWDYYQEVCFDKSIPLESFTEKFERFITTGECFTIYYMPRPRKNTLFKKLFSRFRR